MEIVLQDLKTIFGDRDGKALVIGGHAISSLVVNTTFRQTAVCNYSKNGLPKPILNDPAL